MTPDSFASLRDIHLPEPVSWWPPAPGWWIVCLLVAAFVLYGGYLLRSWRRKRLYRTLALRELQRLAGNADSRAVVQQIALLLKRVAIESFGRQEVARLTGEQWLRFLDQTAGTNQFTQGPGRALGENLYRPHGEVDPGRIRQVAAKWIQDHTVC
jgi:hypothetical protein